MTVRFISDLHFGHKSIIKFQGKERNNVQTVEEHDQWIIDQWNSVVHKRDVTYVLGDVAFYKESLKLMKKLNGVKHLVIGNHDVFPLDTYKQYFNKIHGFFKYKGFWLSHPPILDTRFGFNIHGHTHSSTILDGQHICVCVEALQGKPISLEEIRELVK